MQHQIFGYYLNELEALNGEIGNCPEFDATSQESREDMLRRFDLNRTLVNLLHYTTIHMMRNGADDYDKESERWISGSIARATLQTQRALQAEPAESVRGLAGQAVDLCHEILAALESPSAQPERRIA